ncbi:MAG: aconitase X catalytic domain-containing protein [Candidatus Thermoplasmatota archaeon]|nr:aconitase X catalytic domain-containing protein [Candidatus Thermoplasmatota archaeon]MBU1940318.1 aconitase X catalytic domain-containing protein [Candidatus Thermoplasmatota archaeon]
MDLTKEEEAILNGEKGEVPERMLRLLVRLGEIYGADKMIPIGSVQVAGVSYKSIGEPGTAFLEDLAYKNARVKVLTYLNPAGMDLENWKTIGFPKDFAKNQIRIMNAFKQMGIIVTSTCTPYLAGNLPRFREHIAWSESSAVSFSNSVIGARTNREGGPSALAAAILGKTPNYGLHLWENRQPEIKIKVTAPLTYNADFGALGWYVGKQIKNKIPYFTGITDGNTDQLKALGAAMAASGAVALYHIEHLTPEADLVNTNDLDTIEVGPQEIQNTYESLSTGKNPDVIILGCPHASLREISEVAELLHGKHLKKPLWVCTSRVMKEAADRMGFTTTIEQAGGHIVADTCMVVSPIEQMGFKTTGVNSGKAANYLPGFCKQEVVFNNIRILIKEVE